MANKLSPIDLAIKNQKAEELAPVIKAIYEQESSSGKADTSEVNTSDVRGPMQVKKSTFKYLQDKGYIPKWYKWDNSQHNLEAGVAYNVYNSNRLGTKDPFHLGAAYYGGTGAVKGIGKVDVNRKDPLRPKAPTVGQYAQQIQNRVMQFFPSYAKANSLNLADIKPTATKPTALAKTKDIKVAAVTPPVQKKPVEQPASGKKKSFDDLMFDTFVLKKPLPTKEVTRNPPPPPNENVELFKKSAREIQGPGKDPYLYDISAVSPEQLTNPDTDITLPDEYSPGGRERLI